MAQQDFDLAAELDSVLEKATKQVETFTTELKQINQSFSSLDERDTSQTERCKQLSKQTLETLFKLKASEETNLKAFVSRSRGPR